MRSNFLKLVCFIFNALDLPCAQTMKLFSREQFCLCEVTDVKVGVFVKGPNLNMQQACWILSASHSGRFRISFIDQKCERVQRI